MDYIYEFLPFILTILRFAVTVLLVAERSVEMFFAKKCGIKKYGFVWLPIGREHVLGQIADIYKNKNARKVYPIFSGFSFFGGIFSVAAFIVGLMLEVFFENDFAESDFVAVFIVIIALFAMSVIFGFTQFIYGFIVFNRIFKLKDRKRFSLWFVLYLISSLISFGTSSIVLIVFMGVCMNKPSVPEIDYEEQTEAIAELNTQNLPED